MMHWFIKSLWRRVWFECPGVWVRPYQGRKGWTNRSLFKFSGYEFMKFVKSRKGGTISVLEADDGRVVNCAPGDYEKYFQRILFFGVPLHRRKKDDVSKKSSG